MDSSIASYSSEESNDTISPAVNKEVRPSITSVALASGLVVSVVAGPLIGVGACVTMGAVAMSDTKAGMYSRLVGKELVAKSEQIQSYERKHQIIDRSKKGFVRGCEKVIQKLRACHG